MDANLSSSSLNASVGVVTPTATAAVAPGAALRGADFANLLGSMLANPQRQGLAAVGLAEAGLQAVPLGPQIELITAAKPVPDTGSLMAFARSQGLDESTLAALFGDMAAPAPAGVSGLSATAATVRPGYFLGGQGVLNPTPATPEEAQLLSVPDMSIGQLALQAPVVAAYFMPSQMALNQPQLQQQPTADSDMTGPALLTDSRFLSTAVSVAARAVQLPPPFWRACL